MTLDPPRGDRHGNRLILAHTILKSLPVGTGGNHRLISGLWFRAARDHINTMP